LETIKTQVRPRFIAALDRRFAHTHINVTLHSTRHILQLELETETHADLERQLREAKRSTDIARLRSNIKASEDRKDELNIRAFKCVAAMTALDDMEDRSVIE
jgi:hypothetical protein